MRTQIRLGEAQAGYVQQFQSMSIILQNAFGGEKKSEEPDVPKNISEAKLRLASVLGK